MRTTLVYGGILLVSLGAAWHRWTAEPDTISGDEIVVSQGDADKIESMEVTQQFQALLDEIGELAPEVEIEAMLERAEQSERRAEHLTHSIPEKEREQEQMMKEGVLECEGG